MSIPAILSTIYSGENIRAIETEGVFRCLKKDGNDKTYEINYIDYTDRWTKPDLDQYFELILNKDFYSMEGYLQWNFYYYFISDGAIISKNRNTVKNIEKDEAFARKRVLTSDSFIALQNSLGAIGKINTNKIEKDLYSTWLDELKKQELHFVYDDNIKNFKKSSEDYLSGIASTPPDVDSPGTLANNTSSLNQIKELRLKNYRTYPEQKNFKLGQVVLGYGANATGKTSFLDAIELIVTGKCSRQDNAPLFKIELSDESGNLYTYPDRSNPYKARDSKWYKNYMTRGNNLNGNFNRFNYFTSDAAYELKKQDESSEQNLEKIIADIALGQEVNRLEEKILGFKRRFEEYNDSYLKDLNLLNSEIKNRENEIAFIQQKNTEPKELKDKFVQEMLNRAWSLQLNEDENEFLQQTASQIQIVEECLKKLSNPLISLKDVTRSKVVDKLESLKALVNKIKTSKETAHNLRIKLKEVQASFEGIISKESILTELEKYYHHPSANRLTGLSQKIQDLDFLIKNKKIIQENFNEMPLTDQFIAAYGNLTIPAISQQIEERRNATNLRQQFTQQSIQELEDGIGRLNQILTDIKSAGREFILLDPLSTECPLCGTEFQHNHLITAIEETKSKLSSAQALQNLKDQREQTRTLIVTLEFEYLIVQQLKELTLLNNDYNKIQLKTLLGSLVLLPQEITELDQQLFELETMRSSFQLENLTEDEFVKLNKSWEAKNYTIINPDDISKIRLDTDSAMVSEKALVDETTEELKIIENEILTSYTSEYVDDKTMSNEIFALEENINNFKTLELYIVIQDNKSVHDYLNDLSYIKAAHGLYRMVYTENQTANNNVIALRATIKGTLEKIDKIKPLQSNAKKAFNILNELLVKYNKNEFLKDYINNNRKEIVDIFTLIHSPKEFSDIDIQGNRISLVSGKENRSLDEISTGQRAALALSIFLSLNKKLQNGPGLILLDDPIAYVDDLNLLSFLDYLRALVINSNKQIIFVTANSDLAFLFKMKFEFLEEDKFTLLKFERNEVA